MDPGDNSPAQTRSRTRALGKVSSGKKVRSKPKVADVGADINADSQPQAGQAGRGVVEAQADGDSPDVSSREVEDLVQVDDQVLPGGSPRASDIPMHPLGQGVQQDYIPHGSNTGDAFSGNGDDKHSVTTSQLFSVLEKQTALLSAVQARQSASDVALQALSRQLELLLPGGRVLGGAGSGDAGQLNAMAYSTDGEPTSRARRVRLSLPATNRSTREGGEREGSSRGGSPATLGGRKTAMTRGGTSGRGSSLSINPSDTDLSRASFSVGSRSDRGGRISGTSGSERTASDWSRSSRRSASSASGRDRRKKHRVKKYKRKKRGERSSYDDTSDTSDYRGYSRHRSAIPRDRDTDVSKVRDKLGDRSDPIEWLYRYRNYGYDLQWSRVNKITMLPLVWSDSKTSESVRAWFNALPERTKRSYSRLETAFVEKFCEFSLSAHDMKICKTPQPLGEGCEDWFLRVSRLQAQLRAWSPRRDHGGEVSGSGG